MPTLIGGRLEYSIIAQPWMGEHAEHIENKMSVLSYLAYDEYMIITVEVNDKKSKCAKFAIRFWHTCVPWITDKSEEPLAPRLPYIC